MNTVDIVQLGFAVAIAAAVVKYLIWSAHTQQRFMQRLVENHLAHNTRALVELRNSVQQLSGTVAELKEWLRRQL